MGTVLLCPTCAATHCKVRDDSGGQIVSCRLYVEDIGLTGKWDTLKNITAESERGLERSPP